MTPFHFIAYTLVLFLSIGLAFSYRSFKRIENKLQNANKKINDQRIQIAELEVQKRNVKRELNTLKWERNTPQKYKTGDLIGKDLKVDKCLRSTRKEGFILHNITEGLRALLKSNHTPKFDFQPREWVYKVVHVTTGAQNNFTESKLDKLKLDEH